MEQRGEKAVCCPHGGLTSLYVSKVYQADAKYFYRLNLVQSVQMARDTHNFIAMDCKIIQEINITTFIFTSLMCED